MQTAQETSLEVKKTGRFVRELGKQIGALGNKFGGFTEGLYLARIHDEVFQMETPDGFQGVDFSLSEPPIVRRLAALSSLS